MMGLCVHGLAGPIDIAFDDLGIPRITAAPSPTRSMAKAMPQP